MKPGLSGEFREGSPTAPRGRKYSCDGKCSGKKRCDVCKKSGRLSRADALTPLEYLSACELGIQRNDSNYVRGYIHTLQIREDKKCGKSGIPANAKCKKGGGNANTVGKVALTAGAVAGAVAAARNPSVRRAVGEAAWNARLKATPVTRQVNRAATATRQAAQRGARTASVVARRKVGPVARRATATAQRTVRAGDVMARRSVGLGGRRAVQSAAATARRGARTASVVTRRRVGSLRRRLR